MILEILVCYINARKTLVEKISVLSYNLFMRKFLSILFILLVFGSQSVMALPNKKESIKFRQSEQYQNISSQANVFYAGNELSSALNLFLSIPEEQRSAQNWLLMGNILQDQGKFDEAVFMYNKAIQVDGEYYKAYFNLGNIYLQDGKPNMAIEQYKKVIKLKPDYAYGHYNLACAYIKLGKYSKAKYELFNAIDLKNNVADFHYNLAYVYKKLNKEKTAKAYLEHYNKLAE